MSNANSSYDGTVALTSGTLQVGAASDALGTGYVDLNGGTIESTVAGGAVLSNAGYTLGNDVTVAGSDGLTFGTGSSSFTLGGGNVLTLSNSGTTIFTTDISGAGAITQTAGTVKLQGSNSYTGATTVSGGTLSVQNVNGLGNGTSDSSGVSVANGATLDFDFNGTLGNSTAAIGLTGSAAITGSGTATVNNAVSLGSSSTLGGTGTLTLGGTVSDGGNGYALTKTGSGTLQLSGANTYTGGTTINAGTLEADSANALSTSGAITVNNSATIGINANATLGNSSTITLNNSAGLEVMGAPGSVNTLNNNITLGANSTATISAQSGTTLILGSSVNGANATPILNLSGTGNIHLVGDIGTTQQVASLTSSAPLTILGSTIETVGDQTYTVSPITLGNDASYISDTGNISFGSGVTIIGAYNLITQSAGTTTFDANVNVATLNATATGGINVASGVTIQTSGAQQYFSPIALTGTTAGTNFTSTAGDVTASSAASITLNGNTLTVSNTGTASDLAGEITDGAGGSGSIVKAGTGTLSIDNALNSYTGGTTVNAGTLNVNNSHALGTSGALTVNGATLALNLGGGTTTFANTSGLTLNNGATLTETDAGIDTVNNAITLSGSQTINSGAGSQLILGTGGINGAGALTLSGPGAITINSNVGTGTALTSITASGPLTLGGITAKTTGAQSYSGAVTLTGATTLTSTGSTISESGSGAIGGSSLTTTSVGGTTLNGANTLTGLTATNTGSGDIDLTNTTSTLDVGNISQAGGGNVAITNTGAMTVDNTAGHQITTDGGNVNLTTLAATNPLTVNGNISTSGGNIDLNAANNDPTNSGYSALVVNSVLNTSTGGAGTPGMLTFGGGAELNGSPNLGGTGQGGNITLQGNGSDITLGTVSFSSAVGFAAVQDITINGAVTTSNGAGLTLTADVNNTGTGGVDITTGGSLNIAGALTINGSSVGGTGPAIDIESGAGTISAGSITLSSGTSNGNIDIGHALTATGAGGITANAGTGNIALAAGLTSGGAVNLNSAVVVSNTPTINAGSNAVNFNSGVSGTTLGLQQAAGGTVTFGGNVNLAGLTTNAAAYNIAFNGTNNTMTNATTFNNAGVVSFANGTNTFTGGLTNTAGTTSVAGSLNTTNNNMTLGAVTLSNDATLNSGSGAISLGNINGGYALSTNSSTGTTLNGAVNTASLSLNGGGTDTIATSTVTTSGSQSYNDAVMLSNDATLTSTGNGTIAFANGASGASQNLTLAGGTGNNTFSLAGNFGVNSLAVTGGSGGNNTLAVQAPNTTWTVTGTNAGNVGGVSGLGSNDVNFTQVQNLTANANNTSNVFTLQGGTLSGSITGGGSNNSLTANSGTNIWNINAANAGSVTGVGGGFTDIQNLSSGTTGDNTFNFSGNGAVTSVAGSVGGNNLMSFVNTINATFTSQTGGYVSGLVSSFSNINNITGNGQSTLQLSAGLQNTVHITGFGAGFFNDPTNFSGFSNMVGQNTTTVTFDTPATPIGPNTYLVNGQVMQFNSVAGFGGQIVAPPIPDNDNNVPIQPIVSNQVVNAIWPANGSSNVAPASVVFQSIGFNPMVSNSIQDITQQQQQLDTALSSLTVNLNCGG